MRVSMWFLFASLLAAGCSNFAGDDENDNGVSTQTARSYEELAAELPPEERRYWDAGRPFVEALAGQRYDEAYELLSTHARARMSLSQFLPPDHQAQARANEQEPLVDVTREKFVELVESVTHAYGDPQSVNDLYVQSIDPVDLAGRGDSLDVLFAIGAMPDSIPADIRKASLRGQLATQPKPEERQPDSAENNKSGERVARNGELPPYFSVKLVLVEEQGEFRVGYFEFLPPPIWD